MSLWPLSTIGVAVDNWLKSDIANANLVKPISFCLAFLTKSLNFQNLKKKKKKIQKKNVYKSQFKKLYIQKIYISKKIKSIF